MGHCKLASLGWTFHPEGIHDCSRSNYKLLLISVSFPLFM